MVLPLRVGGQLLSGWDAGRWSDPRANLVLRYLKHRWRRDVADLLEASRGDALALDDVDFDNDARELIRTAGQARLIDLATAVLRSDRGDAPRGSRLPGARGRGGAGAPVPAPVRRERRVPVPDRRLARRPARVRRRRSAPAPRPRAGRGLDRPGPPRGRSPGAGRGVAPGGGRPPGRSGGGQAADPPRLGGARLHVEAEREALEKALAKALRPAKPIPWPLAATSLDARKFIALRARGGWITLLAEGERPDPDLARALAREAGIGRAAWACLDAAAPDLRVFDGTQTVVDAASLADRVGRTPTGDDVAGALRALGVLDLDPEHPRGLPALAFNAYADSPLRQQGAWGIALG